jgi:glycosyltransferase involved in cell wall biosynthesis
MLTILYLFPIIQNLIEKKNILILLTASYGGGAEKLVLDQAKFYNKDVFKLHIITFREGNIENEFRNLKDVKYLCLQTPKKFSFKTISKLLKYIKKNRINMVHAHLIEAELYSFPLKIFAPTLKIILTKHNANEFKKKIFFRLISKIISILVDKIICVSETIKDFSVKYELSSPRKIQIAYNGIDPAKFKKNHINGEIEKSRKKFGFKKDDFLVGIIGRLTKQKGHIYLVKAAEKLINTIPRLKILVIGEGELKDFLEFEIIQRGLQDIFVLTGHIDNMFEIYSILDIVCIPSLWEGLSLVLLEAMSMENLVIMSDLPNNIEVAEENKEAIYFQTGNHEELAEKIYYYYQNPDDAKKIGNNARKKILHKFNYIDNLKKIENLYMDVIGIKS